MLFTILLEKKGLYAKLKWQQQRKRGRISWKIYMIWRFWEQVRQESAQLFMRQEQN